MDFYQIMRIMKISMVLITCFFVQVSAATYGQLLTINKQDSSIPDILKEVRRQASYDFVYDANIFNGNHKIRIDIKNGSIEQVLAACFTGLPFEYKINNRIVTINRSSESQTATSDKSSVKQQLRITGRVVDASDGSALPGVSVRVKGFQTGAITDTNGNFSIEMPQGSLVLVFSYISYQTKELTVTNAQSNIVVPLTPATKSLNEVSVQARRNTRTEVAVLEERKKSSIVQDAISAQQIERTGSITTTQALQRVAGVTVTDDKYIAVRGLGDRSVIGQLNGVRLASSDPDRSAIPLDLVPASLLDNITVYKTVTPDKPADAASGIVELKTKSVPKEMTFELIAQTGANSNVSIDGKYNSFWNSDMGVLGKKINDKNLSQDFLNLSHQYPDGLPAIQKMIANSNYNNTAYQEVNRINGIMQRFDPIMTTGYKKAPLNQLYSATFGNSYSLFNKHKLGVILGGNYYRRTSDIHDGNLTQYSIYQGVVTGNPDVESPRNIPNYITPNSIFMGKYQTYKENTGKETLNYGILTGLTYRFNPRHEVSFQYMGSWGGETTASNLYGSYEYTGLPGEVASTTYSLKQTYRTLNTFNLQGEHKFMSSEYSPVLSYNIAHSQSSQNDPDYRFVNLIDYTPRGGEYYTKYITGQNGTTPELVATNHLYALASGYVNGFGPYGIMQAEPNGRRWRGLNEVNYNYKADLGFPFSLFGQKQTFKTGFNYLFRDRTFTENQLFLPGSNFSNSTQLPLYTVEGNLNRLVGSDIIGVQAPKTRQGEGMAPVGGFLYNMQKSPNNYIGYYLTNAYYAMLDLQLTKQLRIAGGVRFEMTNIGSVVDTSGVYIASTLTSNTNSGGKISLVNIEPNSLYKERYKPFYSVNATYTLNGNMNFRAAFNTTLARPELREITNVYEFDAFQMGLVVGNPNLRNQSTKNLDFRWEWFPKPGEVIAVSAFGKQIENQLVKVFELRTEGLATTYMEFPTIQFQNDPNRGKVYGLELELVKDLGLIWNRAKHFFIGANLLLAQSQIRKSEARYEANASLDRYTPRNSPLFEQAPYSINTWLNYDNKSWGTDLTATFNTVGERLVQINLTGEPDLYTRPAAMLDLIWTQRINKRFLFKGYAKNILNPDIKTVYANPKTGGKWHGGEYVNRSFKLGAEIMLGFTYKLF